MKMGARIRKAEAQVAPGFTVQPAMLAFYYDTDGVLFRADPDGDCTIGDTPCKRCTEAEMEALISSQPDNAPVAMVIHAGVTV